MNNKTMTVTLGSKISNNTLDLNYFIFDTTVSDKWAEMISGHLIRESELRFNHNRLVDDTEIELLFEEFRKNIAFINKHYDRQLVELRYIDDLVTNPALLNILHEEFEIYGDRIEEIRKTNYYDNNPDASTKFPGAEFNLELDHAFRRLNEQIHNHESIIRNWESENTRLCSCLVDWVPKEYRVLQDEEYLLFTPELHWGYIYLGYSTTGKHWHSTSYDNDLDVVRRGEVRPQQQYSAEFYMNFSLTTGHYHSRLYFYKWWKENKINDINDINKMSLRDLAFGYIPLGKLVGYRFNNQAFRQVNDSIPYREQLMFNKDVWSRFDFIKSVRFV